MTKLNQQIFLKMRETFTQINDFYYTLPAIYSYPYNIRHDIAAKLPRIQLKSPI